MIFLALGLKIVIFDILVCCRASLAMSRGGERKMVLLPGIKSTLDNQVAEDSLTFRWVKKTEK